MTIADAAILAARKACEEKTSLETIASEEATPSEKTVITPVTSDLKRTEDRGNNRDTRNLRREKNRVSQGVILAIILIACIAGGIYWYLQSDKTSDLQSPATIKTPKNNWKRIFLQFRLMTH